MVRFGFGLTRLKDGLFTHYTQAEGLPVSSINGILDDPSGHLWMTSKQGVFRISHAAFEQFAQGKASQFHWQHFTDKNGLPSNECHGEQSQPSLCRTQDCRIWIPTSKGVGVIDPEAVSNQGSPPPVVIQEVILYSDENHVTTLLSDGEFSHRPDSNPISVTIPPGNNNLLIRYTAVEFTAPKEVHFKYRIVGLEDQWIDARNERTTMIAALKSGSYRFELIASNHLMQGSERASLSIIVQPFWWETALFRLLIVTGLMTVGFTWYFKRIQQLKRKNELQADFSHQLIDREEIERKRISQALHDSLGHELLLLRNRALDGANQADNPTAQEQFEDISNLAGQALENARGMAYNLRPFELDRIGFKKAIETMISKIAESSSVRYFKDIDALEGVLTSTALVHLYRLIQEALNNILKHSNASVVMLEIKIEKAQVRVQLDDNGNGFDTRIHKAGMGLNGMEERAKLIRGKFHLTSAPGEGTQIRILIPTQTSASSNSSSIS